MSGHPRDKHPSPVSTPSHKATAPVPKNRNRELRADFLLNFQRPPAHQRPQAYAPPPRRSRPSGRQYGPVAFAKGRFVQSAFRLFVDEITPDVVEAALCADSLLKWESVCQVDLICEQPAKCPICLEVDMVVPKITKCGHAFCAPCILRYFLTLTDYNKKVYQRCPVCNEQVCPNELTSARFEEIKALRENDRTTFVLVHRDANSTIVRTHAQSGPGDASGDPLRLPSRADRGWHFSRLVRLLPAEANRLLQEETEALESFRMVVQADGERELLPSIDAALDLTRQRQKRRAERGSSGPAEEDLMLPAPAMELPAEEEEEDVPDEPGDPEGDDMGSEPQTSPQYASQPSPSSPPIRAASSPVLGASQASPGAGQGRPQLISFYQASDGRLVFLEPFFTKLLLHEHGGRWDGLPPVLEELRLGRLQELSVSEEARRRHRFLQHLPLGTVVSLAEVDLRAHLSQETKDFFAEEFNKRRQQKKKDKTRDLRNQRIGKTRAAEEEERIYQALNLSRSAPIQQKPTAEDFAVPLPGREAEVTGEDGVAAEGAGAAGDDGEGEEEGAGPTLAEKIKGRMAGKAKAKTKPRPMEDPTTAFPQLGGSAVQAGATARSSAGGASSSTAASASAGSSSAWGRGCGSSRVKKDKDAPDGSLPAGPTGTGWDDDDEAGGAGPADENPTFGQALEAALRSAEAEAEADQPTGEAGAGASAAGAKKKKGRAGKATTIRLFG